MNLQENIFRIKQMMGVLNEQTEKLIEVVTGSFTAKNCDELHAFQSTCPSKVFTGGQCYGGTKLVGNMHEKMRIKLDAIYQKGINPKVSKVEVSVNGMKVTWTCTIVESTDGKAWVGFTSRGAGCNYDIIERATSAVVHNDVDTIKARIDDMYKEPIIEIEEVNDFIYNGGGNSFRQIFYRYTKPKSSPPHKSKPTAPNPQPTTPGGATATATQPTTPGGATATATQPTTPGGATATATQTATQPTTPGGATATATQPTTPGGATSTATQTTAKPYPSIDNPFTPRNGDPWKYAYDGTNLIVKSPTTGNEYNLKDPNYFTTYPYSKLKNEEQLNNAIASIKNAYGEKLGM